MSKKRQITSKVLNRVNPYFQESLGINCSENTKLGTKMWPSFENLCFENYATGSEKFNISSIKKTVFNIFVLIFKKQHYSNTVGFSLIHPAHFSKRCIFWVTPSVVKLKLWSNDRVETFQISCMVSAAQFIKQWIHFFDILWKSSGLLKNCHWDLGAWISCTLLFQKLRALIEPKSNRQIKQKNDKQVSAFQQEFLLSISSSLDFQSRLFCILINHSLSISFTDVHFHLCLFEIFISFIYRSVRQYDQANCSQLSGTFHGQVAA